MNSVRLSSHYRLYAFSDYQGMRAAVPYLQRVVLAKGLAEVQVWEVRRCLQRIDGKGYKNYLEPLCSHNTFYSASRSFITALQLLYKSNGYPAKYVVIERP